MAYVLGIDIGTSFTAAAVARLGGAGTTAAPQSLGLGMRGGVVPSVAFLGEDGQVLVGEAAERRAATSPERVVREFKRRVGDTVPIVAGDLFVAPEDVFAVVARWVVDRAEEREGTPPEAVTLTHPAGWGDYRKGLVRQALAGVGLAEVTLLSEPEAAALHYASQERVEPESTIAVYDLGGGTFDAAILRKTAAGSFDPLGRPEGIERLGGVDFDEAVFGHVTAGAGDLFTGLDASDPAVLVALSRVRRECTEAKEALSCDSEASIPVLLPGSQAQVRLVRQEFEILIEASVRQSVEALRHVMQTAGVGAGDLAAILLVGGSSRIPLVTQLLSAELGRPIAIDSDPKASVCLGAAFSAAARIQALEADSGGEDEDPASAQVAGHGRFDSGPQPFVLAAAVPDKEIRYGRGVRVAVVAATVAAFTVLTATAAQSPPALEVFAAIAGTEESGGGDRNVPAQESRSAEGDGTPQLQAPDGGGQDAAAGSLFPALPNIRTSSTHTRSEVIPGRVSDEDQGSAAVTSRATPGPRLAGQADAPGGPADPAAATASSSATRSAAEQEKPVQVPGSAPAQPEPGPASTVPAPGPAVPGAVPGPEPEPTVPVLAPETEPTVPVPAPVPEPAVPVPSPEPTPPVTGQVPAESIPAPEG
ncbi:Hsp70 family protein [Crystallibacter degradans]|uniref:Hsp70 family protein n=1 Tax=Crystallibacter degradans TaxID=2726743 RepID=UPI00197C1F28|nr:Hsp70 family protein [Arthrobacter sp. SF27]